MARGTEQSPGTPHPRETTALFGHTDAERALLDAYRSGRMPHAWLIGGPHGIGKATLAYRAARFVLAHPDPSVPAVQTATSLGIDDDHAVIRQIAAQSHGGLLTLQRSLNDKGVLRTIITVDETRETIAFFGSTAAYNGWRVCIVDSVDDLNANGANALLKILEEPPQRSLFLLVSHAPARLLPTILSRCRKLMLRPLDASAVANAVASASRRDPADPALIEAANAAEGSVARALALLEGDAIKLHHRTAALLQTLPRVDALQLHALSDMLPLNDRVSLGAFVDSVNRWIADRVHEGDVNAHVPRLARLAEVWDKVNRAARDTESYNLERKPLVFSVFSLLSEAMA